MNQSIAVSPQAIMAAAVLHARASNVTLEIEEISELLFQLEKNGVDIGHIALRQIPGGVYSEDAEAFVGRFLAAGYAKAMSPIIFSDRGAAICDEIVKEEKADNAANLQRALDLLHLSVPLT